MGKGACAQWLGAELPVETETWACGAPRLSRPGSSWGYQRPQKHPHMCVTSKSLNQRRPEHLVIRTEVTQKWPPCVLQHSSMTAEHSESLACWVCGSLGCTKYSEMVTPLLGAWQLGRQQFPVQANDLTHEAIRTHKVTRDDIGAVRALPRLLLTHPLGHEREAATCHLLQGVHWVQEDVAQILSDVDASNEQTTWGVMPC